MESIQIKVLPTFKPLTGSPQLVQVLDKIRFGPLDDNENYGEFTWFIREYPRVYRHHFDHAQYRLRLIYKSYESVRTFAEERLAQENNPDLFGFGMPQSHECFDENTDAIYWNFESYLYAIGAALDVATRVVGTAYKQDTPPNFNRFCKTAPPSELKDIFCTAQVRWVKKMKAYRDCFVHYTAVDTILGIGALKYGTEWQIRAKLPINPQAREILNFKYSRRVELLTYAVTVWKNLVAFDRAVSKTIWQQYRQSNYPQKYENLFTLSRRKDVDDT